MEFARRGRPDAEEDSDNSRRSPDPLLPHGDASMLVIRDALLSQLQKDRLRQEIIVVELAKIERAMALRSIDSQGTKPEAGVSFALNEKMPHSRGAVGPDHDVAENVENDLKKKDGVRGDVAVELESEKPATEDAGKENAAALDECKLQGSSETMLPKEASLSSVKWSCAICRVKAPTEGHLQQHFAGQKHQSKVANLVSRNNVNAQKAKSAAEKSGSARPYEQKPRPTWVCRFCQSSCTCKSDLENHLRGKRHKERIQALLEECKNMAGTCASPKADSQPNMVSPEHEGDSSTWNCSLCQAKCNRQSDLANHLRGKRHQLNFLVLQVEAKQYLSEWCCGICQAKCNSVSQFEGHCSSMEHQQKVEAIQRGGQNAGSGGFKTPKGASSEVMEIHRTLYFCKLCNLHCNSKITLAEHRRRKKHTEKAAKRMSLSFCEVCNLQCNSKKMLAHHRTGKTHLAKLQGC